MVVKMTSLMAPKWGRMAAFFLVIFPLIISARLSTPDEDERRNLASAECEKTCQDPKFKDLDHFQNSDLMDLNAMLNRLKGQRKKWFYNKLGEDWGKEYVEDIFNPEEELDGKKKRTSAGHNRIFTDATTVVPHAEPAEDAPPEGFGWNRFVQKLQMKIIQIQMGILLERPKAKDICLEECAKSGEGSSRRLRFESSGLYTKFTWATGGHSASAGHGNMFRESYTANMERVLKTLFASIGLDFEARNYAMGGTDCADEVSLCMNSIFGRDIDAIRYVT